MLVKSFSLKRKRNTVKVEFYCLTPKGKEKIVKIYFSLPMLQVFIKRIQDWVEGEAKADYIG